MGKGALIGAGALLGAVLGKQYWDRRKVRIANANDAKDQLRATVEESEVSESANAGDDKTPSGADAEA